MLSSKCIAVAAGLTVVLNGTCLAEDAFGQTVFLSEARIEMLKKRIAAKSEPTYAAWRKLESAASRDLKAEPHAPRDWYIPGYYNDANGHAQAKKALQDDANTAYEMALAYRMTNDPRYAQVAVRLINAWATEVQTLSKKDDSTLSFSYHFPPLIMAADLLKGFPGFAKEDQDRFKTFVREKALPQNTMDRDNNWGNWGLLLVLSAASYLNDRVLFEKGVARWRVLIEKQIADDGHLPHEVTRNGGRSGLWYSNFSLFPQALCAEVALVNGVDLYEYQAPNGRTLRQAFEKLAPWTLNPETFPYWKGDAKELHGSDYVSYYEILVLRWPNADAEALLKAKRPMTASHGAPYVTFTHGGFKLEEIAAAKSRPNDPQPKKKRWVLP